jgi:hypothetical protein
MRELDHHPEHESRYSCDLCSDSGIHNETREYCDCRLGLERCNTDKYAEMLRGSRFTDAMWTMRQATAKAERAIAAADKALLLDRTHRAEVVKLNAEGRVRELERELAELRKDAERYKWLANRVLACDYGDNDAPGMQIGWRIVHNLLATSGRQPAFMYGQSIDQAVDSEIAASVAQAQKEQGNG